MQNMQQLLKNIHIFCKNCVEIFVKYDIIKMDIKAQRGTPLLHVITCNKVLLLSKFCLYTADF